MFLVSCKKDYGTLINDSQALIVRDKAGNKIYKNYYLNDESGKVFYNSGNKIFLLQINYANYLGTKLKTYVKINKTKTKYNQEDIVQEKVMLSYANDLAIAGTNLCDTDLKIYYKEKDGNLVITIYIIVTSHIFMGSDYNIGFASKDVKLMLEVESLYSLSNYGYSVTSLTHK
jgi:hypothetical protein